MKNMIKYLVIILVITLSLNFYVVKAYDSPKVVTVIENALVKNQWTTNSATYTKNNNFIQTYEHTTSFTTLTNPCPKCKIQTALYGPNNVEYIVTVMGDNKQLDTSGLSNVLGDYRIENRRYDTTLLNTYHYALWHLNG